MPRKINTIKILLQKKTLQFLGGYFKSNCKSQITCMYKTQNKIVYTHLDPETWYKINTPQCIGEEPDLPPFGYIFQFLPIGDEVEI